MNYGVHLPLIDFGDRPFSLDLLLDYAKTAEALGYQIIAANDHFLFARPWLDGPTALATVLPHTGRMTLATAVSLATLRGPVSLAKTLGALDVLSGGRLIVGAGPGSSARDYAAVGIPFEERWKRLDEAVQALRSLLRRDSTPFVGSYYSTADVRLEPYPVQPNGPPIWIGSWGSDAGLRRVARLADGWLASAYNTTPKLFAEAWEQLKLGLKQREQNPSQFPNALATMWTYVTDSPREAERVLSDVISAMLNRPVDQLRDILMVGSAEECAARLAAYRDAGTQGVYIWPVRDPVHQLSIFMERVVPLV